MERGEAQAAGGRVIAHYADVADPQSLDAFYDLAERDYGKADIVVNVAGGVARSLFDKTTRESQAREIRLNYGYVIDSCQRAIPRWMRSRSMSATRSQVVFASRLACGSERPQPRWSNSTMR